MLRFFTNTHSHIGDLEKHHTPNPAPITYQVREKISNDLDHRFSNMSNLNQHHYLPFTQEDLNKKVRAWGEYRSSIDFQLTETNSGVSLRISNPRKCRHSHQVAYQSHQGAVLDFISHLWVPFHFSGAQGGLEFA